MKPYFGILIICLMSTSQIHSRQTAIDFYDSNNKDSFSLSSSMQIAFNNRNKISGLECGKGVCFISFKLTKKDILQDLNFSATTPIALRSFIEEYFKISNINWNSILNKAKRNSKTYLLPVSYWFGSCPTSSDTLFIVNGEIYKATKIPSLSDTSNSYPDFFNDLLNIPNSEKGEHRNTRGQPIQYTILETVVLRKRIL